MGYLVISDDLLSQEQLFNVLRDSDNMSLDEGEIPFEVMLANGNEFYVQLLAKKPYEYLVLSMAELGCVLKIASEIGGSPEEVCEMMRVDFQEEAAQQTELQPEDTIDDPEQQLYEEPAQQPPQQPQRKEPKKPSKKRGKKSKA